MTNGDRLTCEIKRNSIQAFSTISLGYVSADKDNLRRLVQGGAALRE